MIFFGIDPGIKNLGLAVLQQNNTVAIRVIRPETRAELRSAVLAWLRFHSFSGKESAVLGLEDYSFFGMRKNYGPMKEIIGEIVGMAFALNIKPHLFQPREKETVSARLGRPVGQSDHEFDARCLAYLAREWWQEGMKEKKPIRRKKR